MYVYKWCLCEVNTLKGIERNSRRIVMVRNIQEKFNLKFEVKLKHNKWKYEMNVMKWKKE